MTAITRLIRQPDGGFKTEPFEKVVRTKDGYELEPGGLYLTKAAAARCLADKKRAKNAKKKSKLRSEQNRRNSDIAENSAIVARERLNMGKTSNTTDMVDIAKGVIAGRDQGVDSRHFYREILKRSATSEGRTEAIRFTKFISEDPSGRLLYAAMKKAPQKAWDEPMDGEDEPDADDTGTDPYKRMMAKAEELRATNPHLTQAQLFSRLYSDPKNRRLADADKAAHMTKMAKRVGLG